MSRCIVETGTSSYYTALYEAVGYHHWGTNPNYAVVEGRVIPGRYYTKQLRAPRGSRARSEGESA